MRSARRLEFSLVKLSEILRFVSGYGFSHIATVKNGRDSGPRGFAEGDIKSQRLKAKHLSIVSMQQA